MDVHATVIKHNIKDLTHSELIFFSFYPVSFFCLNIPTSDKDEELILRNMQHSNCQNPSLPQF